MVRGGIRGYIYTRAGKRHARLANPNSEVYGYRASSSDVLSPSSDVIVPVTSSFDDCLSPKKQIRRVRFDEM